MANKRGIQNYVNTIIFCVVLKIISILVLALILMGYVKNSFVYFLITVELGMVFIVMSALISISSYEKRMAKETKNALNAKINMFLCPDYYTSSNYQCKNQYITSDEKLQYNITSTSAPEYISFSNYVGVNIQSACSNYEYQVGSNIPWSDMESKCEFL